MEIDKQPTLDELEALVKLAEIDKEKRIQSGEKEIVTASLKELTPSQKKLKWNYRKSDSKNDSCIYCQNSYPVASNTHNYFKCNLIGYSGGEATDIRKSYVCDKLEK